MNKASATFVAEALFNNMIILKFIKFPQKSLYLSLSAIILLFIFQTPLRAEAPPRFNWVDIIGNGTDSTYTRMNDLAVANNGDSITLGEFRGTIDFDPSHPGTDRRISSSVDYDDIFIRKLNVNGSYAWTKTITGFAYSSGLSLDLGGNIYITGKFRGTVDFNPGPHDIRTSSTDHWGLFITKLNANGSYGWTKTIVQSNIDLGSGIVKVSSDGYLWVVGYFEGHGTVDFDPGSGVDEHSVDLLCVNTFLSKYSIDGNYVKTWATRVEPRSEFSAVEPSGMTLDSSGNVIITGEIEGSADFNPGTDPDIHSASGFFVTKFNSNGSYGWTKTVSISSDPLHSPIASSISSDRFNNLFVIGGFQDTVDFDPGIGTDFHTAQAYDMFVLKLGMEGTYQWTKTIGGRCNPLEGAVVSGVRSLVDQNNNVLVGGTFDCTVDFDPGDGVDSFTNHGIRDYQRNNVFLTKLDNNGSYLWTEALYSTISSSLFGLQLDSSQNILLTGNFEGIADFDPNEGTYTRESVLYGLPAYVLKLNSQYEISAGVIGGGKTTPSGTTLYNFGTNQKFVISPDSGNHITDILVDRVSQGPIASYSFNNIQSDHTILANFAVDSLYTISAHAASGGTITPNGNVSVNYGTNQSFTIKPDQFYQTREVLVDGVSVGPVASYMFNDVRANHSIDVKFIKNFNSSLSVLKCEQTSECPVHPCQTVTCQKTRCVYQNITGSCNDGDLCTTDDTCNNGTCQGLPVNCSASNDQCNIGICQPSTGTCVQKFVNEDQPCNDGLFCTLGDRCHLGACVPNPKLRRCMELDSDCTSGVCDEITRKCSILNVNEGGSCEDGKFCTIGTTCSSGKCEHGSPMDCSNINDQCNKGVCSEQQNACIKQPANEGNSCISDNRCMVGDTCQKGACEGHPMNCDDHFNCTTDICSPDDGICHHVPVDNCSNGDLIPIFPIPG